MIYSNKPKSANAMIESTSSEDASTIDINTNKTGYTLEEYFGFDPNVDNTNNDRFEIDESIHRNETAMKAIAEHFDLSDRDTRRAVLAMNEADQNSVLTSLTSKLYDNIVSKVDDIDYGDIPASKGDITALPNYQKLNECVELMKGILNEYKQDTYPIDQVALAIANTSTRKDMFNRAYRLDVELPMIMYNNITLSIISSVSYMIATCIEFIKTPNKDSFDITLDKVAYAKTKNNMLYNNLKKFNESCRKGDFDKAMEFIIKNKTGNTVHESIGATMGIIAGTVGIILSIIPILREMVFFFYYTRMRVSEFFDIQADLLQMNAYNIQNAESSKNDESKEHVAAKQLKIVELLRKAANKIAIKTKKAEVETNKEIREVSNKKMSIDDIDISDNMASVLF